MVGNASTVFSFTSSLHIHFPSLIGMSSRRKRRFKVKEWLRDFFPSRYDGIYTPDGPECQDDSFQGIQNIVVNSAIHITGDHNTVVRQDGQGDRGMIVTQIMNLLSQHIIPGAAHDSSARTPPPRCHPDTRVKLITRITTWFEGEGQQELLLWLTGPAGVGKSAIVQTFAEHLVKLKSLGASVFISRPNKRNNPHGIFITIAYQLATRIEAYRNFVAERLRLDPELLNGNIRTQFTTFIVEPFVEKRIGAGGQCWGILLDGLDELRGEDAQCEIIQLISSFVREHRDTPLVWIIASRPESHISNTFDDDDIRRCYWSEYIPIDSTEGCEDVERFLRSSFQMTQKKFRDSVPSDWPSDTDFLKLTAAASGLFVFAEVVMQFIRDADKADPISQLEILLSIIDRSNAIPTKENPFVHLDALYHEILSSIPSALWPTAKQLFVLAIHVGRISGIEFLDVRRGFQTLRGISILFGIPRHTIYACLSKCRSTVNIPDWKVAHRQNVTFFHASFTDYLKDSNRSGEFYVGNVEDVGEDMVLRLLGIWNECSRDDVATASVESKWHQHCSKPDGKTPSKELAKFHAQLFSDMVELIRKLSYRVFSMPAESPLHVRLREVNMIKLCYHFNARDLLLFANDLTKFSPGFDSMGLLQDINLGDLKLGHLDWKEMSPACVYAGKAGKFSKERSWILDRPRSSAELKAFMTELESVQGRFPELKVAIVGALPKGRVAALRCPSGGKSNGLHTSTVYAIPCPE